MWTFDHFRCLFFTMWKIHLYFAQPKYHRDRGLRPTPRRSIFHHLSINQSIKRPILRTISTGAKQSLKHLRDKLAEGGVREPKPRRECEALHYPRPGARYLSRRILFSIQPGGPRGPHRSPPRGLPVSYSGGPSTPDPSAPRWHGGVHVYPLRGSSSTLRRER